MALYGKDTWDCNLYDMVLHIGTMTVDDVVDILSAMVEKGRFNATPESLQLIQKKALLANIHANIVNIAPRATVEIEDGVVTLGHLSGNLKTDLDLRGKTAERLIRTFGVKDVVFAESIKAKKDYVNPFHNIDVR